MNFPKDEDGQVLEMLYKEGVDFNKVHTVDFFISVPNEEIGQHIQKKLISKGIECELDMDEDLKEWTCYCFIKTKLIYDDIIKIQKNLEAISKPHGGQVDG